MLRFGIMGAGRIAKDFADAAVRADGAEVTAVASKSMERAQTFATEKKIVKAYGNYEELLADETIDVVYIATTTNYHYENVIQCLEAGKHVLCEKPIVETEEQAKEVYALAKKKGLFLMEAMWSRFLPKSIKVREWVTSGLIGEVASVQGNLGFYAGDNPKNRFYNPELGGGALYDLGVYLIDLFPFFIDQRIVDYRCDIMRASTGVDYTINLNFWMERCIANGQATFAAKMPEDCFIYGSKGYIHIPKIHWGTEAFRYNVNGVLQEHFKDDEPCGFRFEIEEVVKCLCEGRLTSEVASPEMSYISSAMYDKILH